MIEKSARTRAPLVGARVTRCRRQSGVWFVAWVLSVAACTAGTSETGRPPSNQQPHLSSNQSSSGQPSSSQTNGDPPFTITPLGEFDRPWAAAFLPGTDYLAITEQGGELILRNQRNGKLSTVHGVPRVLDEGQGGLGDLVPAPGFDGAGNRTIYLTWVEAGPADTAGAVLGRAQLDLQAAELTGLQTLWRQPKVTGRGHFGHRIAFAPDGSALFLTSGERQKFTPAQDPKTSLGKVLRFPLTGTGAAAALGAPAIWTSGHRNGLGLAFDSAGRLWESEMGPRGGDELNLIEKGGNYGWPNASNGSHYDGRDIPDHRPGDGYVAPKVWWNPSISPSSLLIYSGDAFASWRGDAFIGALSGQSLIRVDLTGERARKADQWPMHARIRDVIQGPDGRLYLLEDGQGGRLLRLDPLS